MAVTEQSYTGNGSTTNYSFTFPYLKSTDIEVQVDATVTTAWTLANATTVQFNTAPANGAKIKILRQTNVDNLTATFYAGSAIKSEDLNDNYTQNLYKTQEIGNRSFVNTGGTITGDIALGEDVTVAFEGATDNAYETTVTVTDPTADRTITLPNVTGTVVTTGDTGTVTATMLAANSVDSSELVDGSIDTSHIADSQVTAAKLADNAVTTAKINADAVTSAKIADDSIDSEHYIDRSIDAAHIAVGAITYTEIANGTIVYEKLANNSVRRANILDGEVLEGKLADNAVTNAKMADDSVGADELIDASIGAAALASNAVTLAKMADSSVGTSELVNDAVTTVKIADNNVTTAKIPDSGITTAKINNDAVTTAKINADAVTGAEIADNAIDSEHYTDGSIDTVHIAGAQVTDAKLASNAVTTAKITDANVTTDKIANDAITIGKIGCEQTTISDSDSHIPTSGAVVDYVTAQIAPIGGLEVIADEDNFPAIPASGVVISIADVDGIVINGSGVCTTARTAGNGSDNVTINGFPTALRSKTLSGSLGLMVSSTGSSNTYNYHKLLGKEDDIEQLSQDISDFAARYRVNAGEPSSNNDEGDLVYDTSANKMKVYDGSAWGEVTSTGDFKYLFLCPAGGSGAPTLNGSIATYDLREGSNSGSAASVTSAAQLMVSIDGVVQKANTGTSAPSEGFALVDSNTIIFGANLASGSSVFIVQFGSALTINTPGDGTVTAAKIGSGAVTTVKIADDAVTGAKIADNAIDSEHYTDGSIDTAHIAADQITGALIADNAVDSEHYTDGSIDTAHIADDQITLAKMASGTDGVIITYDASGNPVHVGPGTDGQVLTSTGAGSPPAFEDAAGGGGVDSDGSGNTHAGTDAGNSDNYSSATNNSAFGHDALTNLTTGDQNTAIGDSALLTNVSGSNSTAVGWKAGYASTAGENTYVGVKAGEDTTGECNVFLGSNAGAQYTTAFGGVGIGYKAFGGASDSACNGSSSVFIGYGAGEKVTSGSNNTVIGYEAGHKLTTSGSNTIIGKGAGQEAAASFEKNILIGYHCAQDITDGTGNVFVGPHIQEGSGDNNCHDYNTAIGYASLYDIAHGTGNTAAGQSAGADISTGDNNTCIGKDSGLSTAPSGVITTGSNIVCLGNNSVSDIYCADTSISSSDSRDKTDIADFSHGLNWVNKLRPVSYRWDKRTWYDTVDIDDNGKRTVTSGTPDGSLKKTKQHVGFLAQEVLAIEQADGFAGSKDNMLVVNLNEDDSAYGLKYERLVPVLVNAIKELSTEVNTLKTKVATLEAG